MEYRVDGTSYVLSYQELRETYLQFVGMTDLQFLAKVPEALHLACIICYLKEVPSYVCLCDKGIIHELVHLLHLKEENNTSIQHIRELFNMWLKLD